MSSLDENVRRFLSLLAAGDSLAAIEQFYDDEVVVFENRTLARAGRLQCLEYERSQLAAQPTPPVFKLGNHAVNASTGHAFLQYSVRFASPEGRPLRLEEVAVQHWARGKIVEERFYYEGVVDEGDATNPDD